MKLPKLSQYPKEIHINDETYSLKFVKQIPNEAINVLGLCDSGDKVIYIKSAQSPKGIFKTVIHEMLHAFECEYEIKLSHKKVYALELAICSLFLDNF